MSKQQRSYTKPLHKYRQRRRKWCRSQLGSTYASKVERKSLHASCEGLLVSLALTSWSTTGISSGEQQKRVDEWRISGAEKPEHLPLVGNTNGKEYILHGSRSWTLGRLPLSLKQISCPKWSWQEWKCCLLQRTIHVKREVIYSMNWKLEYM